MHFPVISDHRIVWRKQVDELNQDIKEVYGKLNEYFKTSTSQIQSFIGSNNNFFTGIDDIQNSIKLFVENSAIQKNEFEVLKTEMIGMRNDFKEAQSQSIETNKALIEAIKDFNIKLSRIEIVTADNNQ
jgi:translation elongation factor EF-G